MKVTVNGLEINYYDSGSENKEVVLFLHGWGATFEIYRRAVLSPLESKYRVVAFDMPGVGGSQEPHEPMTVADYVDLAQKFAQAVDIKECTLICHSHGGRVSVGIMSDENSPLRVKRAVFIDAAGVVPKRSLGYKLRQRAYKCLRVLGTNKLTKPLFGEVYEIQRDKRSSADYKAASPVMRKTLSNVVNTDMTPFMPKIKVPVLLIWGENDTATPLSDGQLMEKLIPGSGLAVVKGGSHFPFVENPSQFSAILSAFMLQ
ncbi:MAG: alpha/beta hydrolase [Clostridia bacterium]|nr:alpha/beta hydrolase [Clostridia bacterium]